MSEFVCLRAGEEARLGRSTCAKPLSAAHRVS